MGPEQSQLCLKWQLPLGEAGLLSSKYRVVYSQTGDGEAHLTGGEEASFTGKQHRLGATRGWAKRE